MSELWEHSALELAAMIRGGSTTSRAVVEEYFPRVDAVNGDLNAVVRRLDDDALAVADAAVARGGELDVFHGGPMTVKENIDFVGSPTTRGVVAMTDALPPIDAPVTTRLKAAGAIPIGRTNLPDFGLRGRTDSSLHGLTRNPHHPGRTAGGSSGGQASAIASGMSPLGLGNDIGGSLRNPAHCCGIASITPSVGVVPSASSLPPEEKALSNQQMAVEGTTARRVADVRAAFQLVAGADPRDHTSLPVHLTALGEGERLRIAIMAEPPGGATHPEIAAATRSAGDVLAAAGHEVVDANPPMYAETIDLWLGLLVQDLIVIRPLLDAVMGDDAKTIIGNLLSSAPEMTVALAFMIQAERSQAIRLWSEFFLEYLILLSSTWAMPAFEHGVDLTQSDALIRDTVQPVCPINQLGIPAAVVRHGTADGLPVAIQVIGDRFTDLRCLDIAAQVEAASAPLMPIDPVAA
jgi:amidase